MGRRAHYIAGDNWVTCDRCGFTFRRSEIAIEWTGLAVCRKYCFEHRHPQDFVRVGAEITTAPGPIRPDPDDVDSIGYVEAGYWDLGYTNNDLLDLETVNP